MTKNLEKLVAELSQLPELAQMGIANTMLVQLARSRVPPEAIRENACYFIRLVLLVDWDPLGIFGIRQVEDEYDRYVEGVYDLLSKGATNKQIAAHLLSLQTEQMGMGPHCSDLRFVTKKLRALWNELTESQAHSVLDEF